MSEWQPIETCPIKAGEDSEPMLIFCPGINTWNRSYLGGDGRVVAVWTGRHWYSDIGDVDQGYESTGAYFEHTQLYPTHWMPLPVPPA